MNPSHDHKYPSLPLLLTNSPHSLLRYMKPFLSSYKYATCHNTKLSFLASCVFLFLGNSAHTHYGSPPLTTLPNMCLLEVVFLVNYSRTSSFTLFEHIGSSNWKFVRQLHLHMLTFLFLWELTLFSLILEKFNFSLGSITILLLHGTLFVPSFSFWLFVWCHFLCWCLFYHANKFLCNYHYKKNLIAFLFQELLSLLQIATKFLS